MFEQEFRSAASAGNVQKFKEYLQRVQNPNEYDSDGWNALKFASYYGYVEIIQLLFADKRIKINEPNQVGLTPFWTACQEGRIDAVRLFLKEKVDVNMACRTGETPFFIACENGHADVVKLLSKDERVNVNQPAYDKATPFFIACCEGKMEIVKILVKDERIDINQAHKDGASPLFIAAQNGFTEIVKLILSSGREVNTKNMFKNQTCYEIAKLSGNGDVLKLIEGVESKGICTFFFFKNNQIINFIIKL